MSIMSPVKKTYSKYTLQESSNVPRMSEHVTDSNILCSTKTYGKKKDTSISSGNDGSFSATVSEQLKNNQTSQLSNGSEELYPEKNVESVTSNYNENNDIQNNSANSEISLFNDDDTDYYFSASTESPRDHNSFVSIPEASSSGSNYQRTRKNLKNRLRNQRYSTDDLFESTSHEENSNSVSNTKFSNISFNFEQADSTMQNSAVSVDNLVEHAKNSVKVIDACVNKLSQPNSGVQMTVFKKSPNVLPILDLVNKYGSKSKQAPVKKNPRNKRKRVPKESGSAPVKETIAVKHTVSSKVNSVEKKVSNSVVKTPSKVPKRIHSPKKGNNVYVDTMKESVATVSSANNLSVLKKGKVKIPSKTIQKGNSSTAKSSKKLISKIKMDKHYSPTKGKHSPSRNLADSLLPVVKNETPEKMQSANGDKQIQKPTLLMSLITPEGVQFPQTVWGHVPTNNLIQSDISCKSLTNLSIPGPSTSNNNDSSLKTSDYHVKKLLAVETTTTTTIINQTNIGCGPKRFFRPRTHINDGVEFHQFMDNTLKKIENSCSLKLKEISSNFFQMNPSLLNITVKEFLDTPALTDVLLDYVNALGVGKTPTISSTNKGYDFPENFENENFLRVVKDFVHYAISCIVLPDAPKPIRISYQEVIEAAMDKMSNRELIVIMQVFKITDNLYKQKDVCSRLGLVALFVIFDEYKNKHRKSK